MLQIYTDCPTENCIISNDSEFNTATLSKMLNGTSDEYKKIISEIEGVVFVSDNKILSKINNEPISIVDISTGCKTVLNIIYNPDKVVSVTECGDNYSKYIYGLKRGKIYLPHFLVPYDMDEVKDIEVELHTDDGVMRFEDIYGLERWYYGK